MPDTSYERCEPRQKVLKAGRIVFNGGRSTLDCSVRNVSHTGAKLQVAAVVGIPNTFSLQIGNEPLRQCRVMWRTLKEIGVSFPPVSIRRS